MHLRFRVRNDRCCNLKIPRSFEGQTFERTLPVLSSIHTGRGHFDPNSRGYHAAYREGEVNHCPGCGRSHWIIGRQLAECAFCSTALPLSESFQNGQAATVVCRRWPVYPTLDAA
jgi:hypothetical protein